MKKEVTVFLEGVEDSVAKSQVTGVVRGIIKKKKKMKQRRLSYHAPCRHAVLGYELDGHRGSVLHPGARVHCAEPALAKHLGDHFSPFVHSLVHTVQPLSLRAPSSSSTAPSTWSTPTPVAFAITRRVTIGLGVGGTAESRGAGVGCGGAGWRVVVVMVMVSTCGDGVAVVVVAVAIRAVLLSWNCKEKRKKRYL